MASSVALEAEVGGPEGGAAAPDAVSLARRIGVTVAEVAAEVSRDSHQRPGIGLAEVGQAVLELEATRAVLVAAGDDLSRHAAPPLRLNMARTVDSPLVPLDVGILCPVLPAPPEPAPAEPARGEEGEMVPRRQIGAEGQGVVLPPVLKRVTLDFCERHPRLPSAVPVAALAARMRVVAARHADEALCGDGDGDDDSGGSDAGGEMSSDEISARADRVDAMVAGDTLHTDSYRGCGVWYAVAPFPDSPGEVVLVPGLGEYGDSLPPECALGARVHAGQYGSAVTLDPSRTRLGTGAHGDRVAAQVVAEIALRRREPAYTSHNDLDYGDNVVDAATFPLGCYAMITPWPDPSVAWSQGSDCMQDAGFCVVASAELHDALHDRVCRAYDAALAGSAALPAVLQRVVRDYCVADCRLDDAGVEMPSSTFFGVEEAMERALQL